MATTFHSGRAKHYLTLERTLIGKMRSASERSSPIFAPNNADANSFSAPVDTLVDAILIATSMDGKGSLTPSFNLKNLHDAALVFGSHTSELFEEYRNERDFSTVHEVLLGLRKGKGSLNQFLSSLAASELVNMIDKPDARGRTPLIWAVEFGWVSAVKTLLRFGANSSQHRQSRNGNQPLLHLIIARPPSECCDEGPFLDVIRILLQEGVDVNECDHEGWTPLHVAASWCNLDVIETLATFGHQCLSWDACTLDGETALDLAYQGGGDEDVIQRLLRGNDGKPKSINSDHEDELEPKLDVAIAMLGGLKCDTDAALSDFLECDSDCSTSSTSSFHDALDML